MKKTYILQKVIHLNLMQLQIKGTIAIEALLDVEAVFVVVVAVLVVVVVVDVDVEAMKLSVK